MNVPTVRVVYLTDPPSELPAQAPQAHPHGGADVRTLPLPAQVPLALLAAVGERVAASAARMQADTAPGEPAPTGNSLHLAEAERLERFGLQLQELAQIAARAQQLRHEAVDLGLAIVQTVAEWSAESDRLGVELHGPTTSEAVHANPAALKHLLDLMVEHGLQQGRAVRLEVDAPAAAPEPGHGAGVGVTVAMVVSSEPASQCPARDTLAWTTLQWFARSLALQARREVVERGERLTVVLPRA